MEKGKYLIDRDFYIFETSLFKIFDVMNPPFSTLRLHSSVTASTIYSNEEGWENVT